MYNELSDIMFKRENEIEIRNQELFDLKLKSIISKINYTLTKS